MCKNRPPTTALLSSLPCDTEHIRDKCFNFNPSTFQFFTVSKSEQSSCIWVKTSFLQGFIRFKIRHKIYIILTCNVIFAEELDKAISILSRKLLFVSKFQRKVAKESHFQCPSLLVLGHVKEHLNLNLVPECVRMLNFYIRN